MKFNKAILIVFIVFLTAVILQIGMAYVTFLQGKIYADELGEILISFIKIYSIHISILFTGSFFTHLENKEKKISSKILWVSLTLVCLWNAILITSCFILTQVSPPASYKGVIDFQEKIASASSFLITGILSYFFITKNQS
ncbi:hypothetical protein [Mucilaginibacter pocheonensis]|uniref:Membrane protease YdiL (CAAX protease family) n=1 Tax=Mucilaginibacter pocheonensis TaxID=398050 RepID=A0ABU1TEW1_9SPHI|nr:hypothetical protein [Mucilaginibacter pocheonensis]MDR6943789.1 membrane protease YdiL (CAAX protease family) [Mucilaginibacter pocheonensis]